MKKYLTINVGIILFISIILLLSGCNSTTNDVYKQPAVDNTYYTSKDEEITTQNRPHYDEYGVWYEIFVRSFADGNNDGIGDFVGLTKKLDYLNDGNNDTDDDLGINGIWLMPINPSPSYHGYDVTNYYNINEEYGTMEDFETFLNEAHNRGIKVIMDLVINHTSSKHPWFENAKTNKESEYRDYYRWISEEDEGYNQDLQVWGHNVWNQINSEYYYAIFWDQMPDLNFENQNVRDEIINVAKFWLDKGIDGFRMDAAMHIYGQGEVGRGINTSEKNLNWWKEFDIACREVNPNYYLVGEIWDDIYKRSKYADTFDTTFNFDIAEDNILSMVKNSNDLSNKNNNFIKKLDTIYSKLNNIDPTFIDSPFLTNHDQRRAMDYLNGDNNSMKLASNIYLTLPGNPFIYYGEEIGMLGNKPDEKIREPFIWGDFDKAQTNWEVITENQVTSSVEVQERIPDSLLNHYKEIIRVRQKNEALLKGNFEGIETSSSKIIAYHRSTENETVTVVHNLAKEPLVLELSKIITDSMSLLYSSNTFIYNGEDIITLPAQTTLIFK